MCTASKTIINRTCHYVSGKDKLYIDVPCGQCDSCRLAEQDSWFIRAYGEWLTTISAGGCVVFSTMTYNEKCVPWLRNKRLGLEMRCFRYRDIDRFMHKLRKKCVRKGLCNDGIKYIACPEFGPKTHRPHWHFLIYFPFRADERLMKSLIRKCWRHGFVNYSKAGLTCENDSGVRYATKYCCKSLDFFDYPMLQEHIDYIKDKYGTKSEAYKQLQKKLPRHYQSKNFGYQFLSNVLTTTKDLPTLLSKGIKIPMQERYYKLPRWIFQRMCYDNPTLANKLEYRSVNNFGLKILQLQNKLVIRDMERTIKDNLTDNNLENIFAFSRNVPVLGKRSFSTYKEFRNFLYSLLNGRSLHHLCVYDKIYRGRSVVLPLKLHKVHPCKLDLYSLIADAPNVYTSQLYRKEPRQNTKGDIPPLLRIEPETHKPRVDFFEQFMYNQLPCFEGFDMFLTAYRNVMANYINSKKRSRVIKHNEISYTNDVFYNT